MSCAAYSPDGSLLAAGDALGNLELYRSRAAEERPDVQAQGAVRGALLDDRARGLVRGRARRALELVELRDFAPRPPGRDVAHPPRRRRFPRTRGRRRACSRAARPSAPKPGSGRAGTGAGAARREGGVRGGRERARGGVAHVDDAARGSSSWASGPRARTARTSTRCGARRTGSTSSPRTTTGACACSTFRAPTRARPRSSTGRTAAT